MPGQCKAPRLLAFLAPALFLVFGAAFGFAQELPLFDAHIHYSGEAWDRYPPAEVLRLFDQAGIRWALVSSTPDEGTRRLYEAAPGRVVPLLRLYRNPGDVSTWQRDTSLLGYLEEQLASGFYRGVGEVHLAAQDAEAPVVRRAVELASQRGLVVQVHTDAKGMEALLARYPAARFLWAHAGLGEPPDAARYLLERSPNLWVELALRYDVAPGGRLDPRWRALFLSFPDRFLVGTDTWITPCWAEVVENAAFTRSWLRQLPAEVAEKIAWRNGQALFPPAQ